MDCCCHGPERCWNDTRKKRWKVFNSIFTRLKISHRNPTLAMKNWSYHQVPWEAMLYGFIHSFIFKVFHSFMFTAGKLSIYLWLSPHYQPDTSPLDSSFIIAPYRCLGLGFKWFYCFLDLTKQVDGVIPVECRVCCVCCAHVVLYYCGDKRQGSLLSGVTRQLSTPHHTIAPTTAFHTKQS